MNQYRKIYLAATALAFLAIGWAFVFGRSQHMDIVELSDNHPAVKMYREGVWRGRYERCYINDATDERSVCLSIDVQEDMSREDMESILGYYELVWNARYVGDSYVGERDTDFLGYAVFYRGETDEELARMKYFNGAEAEITEEDEERFPRAYMHSDEGNEPRPWF